VIKVFRAAPLLGFAVATAFYGACGQLEFWQPPACYADIPGAIETLPYCVDWPSFGGSCPQCGFCRGGCCPAQTPTAIHECKNGTVDWACYSEDAYAGGCEVLEGGLSDVDVSDIDAQDSDVSFGESGGDMMLDASEAGAHD